MKTKQLLLIIAGVTLVLNACKKDKHIIPINNSIEGKWLETKLELGQAYSIHPLVRDTTFTSTAFTTGDYYEFNGNNGAVISQSGTYAFGGKTTAINGGNIVVTTTDYIYNVQHNQLGLTHAIFATSPNNPPFTQTYTILQLDDTHLVLRTTYFYAQTDNYPGGDPYTLTTTAYFTRMVLVETPH